MFHIWTQGEHANFTQKSPQSDQDSNWGSSTSHSATMAQLHDIFGQKAGFFFWIPEETKKRNCRAQHR